MAAANVSAVVLAAGSDHRFGANRNKLLAEWRGRTLIEHVISAATNAWHAGVVNEVLVIAPAGETRIKSLAVADGCRVLHPALEQPISASLQLAVSAVHPGTEGVVVLLADQPMVTRHAVQAVVEAAGGSPQALVRARYNGYADPVSHPAYIGRYHFGMVHRIEGSESFHLTTERQRVRWKEVWLDGDNPDVDHPFDLERLR